MPASQNDIGILASFLTPRGYEQIDLTAGVKALTLPNVRGNLIIAEIQGDDGNVRYRDDGVDPTTAIGQLIFQGETLIYMVQNASLIRLETSTVNGATKANVTYYSLITVQEVP